MSGLNNAGFLSQIDFEKLGGLVPVIARESTTGEVLMHAYMDRQAVKRTIEKGKACYYSRSRNKYWIKGEESGHFQLVKGIFLDCDGDTILLEVEQLGKGSCHKGYNNCFYRKWDPSEGRLKIVGRKAFDPDEIYEKKKNGIK